MTPSEDTTSGDDGGVGSLTCIVSLVLLGLYWTYIQFTLQTREGYHLEASSIDEYDEDEIYEDNYAPVGPWQSLIAFVVLSFVLVLSARCLMMAIDDTVSSTGVSRGFLGLIIIPLVAGGSETWTSAMVAVHNKMDLVSNFFIFIFFDLLFPNPPQQSPCCRLRPR